jgi:hypothetical protein
LGNRKQLRKKITEKGKTKLNRKRGILNEPKKSNYGKNIKAEKEPSRMKKDANANGKMTVD